MVSKATSEYVVLCGVSYNGERWSLAGISYEEYIATDCLIGQERFVGRADDFQFSCMEIDLAGLEEWLRVGNIRVNQLGPQITISYSKPDDVVYDVDGDKVTIRYDLFRIPYRKSRHHSVNMREAVTLVWEFYVDVCIEVARSRYALVSDIFILLTNYNHALEWPIISLAGAKYRWCFPENATRSNPSDRRDRLTNFVQLRDQFGHLLQNWKQKREKFGAGFYLYIATRRGRELYDEHRFVSLIWGIEAFHRTKYPSTETSSNLEDKVNRIIEQIQGKEDKGWLKKRLAHVEVNLADRMVDTFSKLHINIDKNNLRQFCNDCARKRNDISHFGGPRQKEDNSAFSSDLNRKSRALSFLYHVLLLHEIGVGDILLNEIVYRGHYSDRIKRCFMDVGLLDANTSNDGA